MRVLWITNIPSPYRVDFFNLLGENINLTVLFEMKKSSERSYGWEKYNFTNFDGIFLKGIKTGADNSLCLSVIKYIKKKYDIIVMTNFSTFTGIIASFYMIRHKIKYILESDGGFAKNEKSFSIRRYIKRKIISNSSLCFSTSVVNDNYYQKYGAILENIVRYPFTSISSKDIADFDTIKNGKNERLIKLGFNNNLKMIVSVGQFIHRKGFDLLLESANHINANIVIIGGEATEEYLNIIKNNKISNVYFLPFLCKKDLFEYFRAAHVFVLPTREDIWGLVINEAMSQGLPVITTTTCIAGLELISEGENGFLYHYSDTQKLIKYINFILNLSNFDYYNFASRSIEIMKTYTFEEMANIHIQKFKQFLKDNRFKDENRDE